MAEMTELTLSKGKYAGDLLDRNTLVDRFKKQGLHVFSWSDQPGTTYSPHQHPHDEIIVVVSGRIVFTIDGESYALEAGDELWLPEGTEHSARVPGGTSVDYLICSQ